MGNHKRQNISILGHWHDVTLHDISDITSIGEYEDTRRHALREDAEFSDIDYRVYRLIDQATPERLNDVNHLKHVVFDAAYTPDALEQNDTLKALEYMYRESLFSLIVDRVVLNHIDSDRIYLATVVCGDNITVDGEIYTMHPALHLLVDGHLEHDAIIAMIASIYDYMAVHGYTITGEPSDFLIDL